MRTVGQARPAPCEPVDRRLEQRWRGRQEDRDAVARIADRLGAAARSPPGSVMSSGDIMEPRRGTSPPCLPPIETGGRCSCSAASARSRKRILVQLGPRRSDDPQVVRQKPVRVQPVKRWKAACAARGRRSRRTSGGWIPSRPCARLLQRAARLRKGRMNARTLHTGCREGVAVGVEIAQVAPARLLAEPGDQDQRQHRRHHDHQRNECRAAAPARRSRAIARSFRPPWCRRRPPPSSGRGCAAGSFRRRKAEASRSARWCR